MLPTARSDQAALKRRALLFTLVFFAVWIMRAVIYRFVDQSIDSKLLSAIATLSWKTLVWMAFPVFYLVRVEKRDPIDYLRLSNISRKIMLWCLGIVLFGIVWQLTLVFLKLDTHFPDLQATVLAIWGAGVCEEILFRGFLLLLFSEFMAFVPAMVTTSLLFVGAHVPGWLIFMDYSLQHVLSSGAYVFVASIVFSLLLRKTGSLYPSIVLHAINDLIAL